MHPIPVMTIDGPTASGKGTVARGVAQRLGFHLLDSGAIYRAFALSCLEKRLNFNDFNKLEEEAKALPLRFEADSLFLSGVDATDRIRAEAVGMFASKLSAIAEVRRGLFDRQRAFAQTPGLVADGRDMGTVVFPNATLKVFLTATAEVRAARRHTQLLKAVSGNANRLIEKGNSPTIPDSLERVIAQIRQRDLQDRSRSIAPLKPAADAIVIDNAAHGPHETIDAVLSLWTLRCS